MPVRRQKSIREVDLYPPIRDYLESQGYTVRGEVLGCDITAVKGDELIVIELKRQIALELLIQAAWRQRLTDSVYVAAPRPEAMPARKWRGIQHLLRRLELGLILVAFSGRKPRVEVAFHPVPFARKKQPSQRRAILREIAGRSADLNPGGSTRRKLVTAYREQALRIAWYLDCLGPKSPKALRALGACEKTRAILYDNVYGWFARVDRGLYALDAKGRDGLAEFAVLIAQWEVQEGPPVEPSGPVAPE